MVELIGLLGVIGVIGGLVMIVVNLIRKRPVKKYALILIGGFILFGISVALIEDPKEKVKDETIKGEQVESSAETKVEETETKVEETETKVEKKKESEEPTPDRDFVVGKSDKDIKGIIDSKPTTVRNDVTGKWRIAKHAEPINIDEYAVSYSELYMQDDSTVHVIINFTNKTTTLLIDYGDYINSSTYEYVSKEEHDAKKIPSGMNLGECNIYKDNGDIVDVEKAIQEEQKNN